MRHPLKRVRRVFPHLISEVQATVSCLGKIEIIGKSYGGVELEINGEGNSCSIAVAEIPTTPYSIGTLPMTESGDLGPIAYDVDGDGVQDFSFSLLHPPLPQKFKQLIAVIEDMRNSAK